MLPVHDVWVLLHGVVDTFEETSSGVPIGVSLQIATLHTVVRLQAKEHTLIDGFLEIFWKTLSSLLRMVTKAGRMASFAHSVDGRM